MNLTINVDLGKKCVECGKGGAMDSGICLKCTGKMMMGTKMKSDIGKAVEQRYRKFNRSRPRPL
jgi:hypothetical protein